MKPVSSNVDNYPSKKGCTPINASCIVWEGPDIPCIELCKGDTIDKVVYDLAKILCDITENILDVSTLDFACLIESGECPPETLLETLQILINKACEDVTITESTPYEEPLLLLPNCLIYTNREGDTVTQLYLSEYVTYLASKICEILLSIASINSAINNINIRLIEIETLLETIGSSGSPTINITTQCLSSNTPGEVIPIEVAFHNLEQALCSYIQVVGDIDDWQNSLSSICINSLTPLPCGEGTFGGLPNWIDNPTTAAGSVNNLWVALCAVTNCVSSIQNGSLICQTYDCLSISIESGSTSADISWVPPITPIGYENPTGYTINIYDLASNLIISYNVPFGNTNYVIYAGSPIITDQNYNIEIVTNYSCGSSAGISEQSKIITGVYLYEVRYSTANNILPGICNMVPYAKTETTITIGLYNISSGLLTTNGGLNPIEIVLEMNKQTCTGPTNPLVTVSILPGASTGTYTFDSSEVVLCPLTGLCTPLNESVNCLSSFDDGGLGVVQLDSSVPLPC